MLTRRALLQGAAFQATSDSSLIAELRRSPSRAEASPGAGIRIERSWTGDLCRVRISNRGPKAVQVREVVVFDLAHSLPPSTPIYGESFQMLSQTSGTLGKPVDLAYSETGHYKIPQPEGVIKALTGMLALEFPPARNTIFAFTSCRRFAGRFYLRPGVIEVVQDLENQTLAPGETVELEEFMALEGPSRPDLLARLAARIRVNHPPLEGFAAPPTGWCSWYCFGPRVTAKNVRDNLAAIAADYPGLKYVQIDDGYQPAMGDWLETGNAFGGQIQSVLSEIRDRGRVPALWVAPFIAEAGSKLFQEHPKWFIQDDAGAPLQSSKVTFGGWRHGPWYALDGTHPEARQYLETVFRTMRQDWGVRYFKLDANFWGAMHGGRFHDPKATRIEAYRRGMGSILKGAGDSFILGCNHPIWPSFGLIHGSRSSGDISRKWNTIRKTAFENLNRNWQNGALWWNDPDAIVLDGTLPENEFRFHATAVYASGGMILSGDDLAKMPPDRGAMLKRLLPPTGVAAKFNNASLSTGWIDLPGKRVACAFNWTEAPIDLAIPLERPSALFDFWSGNPLGRHSGKYVVAGLAPRHAELIEIRPA